MPGYLFQFDLDPVQRCRVAGRIGDCVQRFHPWHVLSACRSTECGASMKIPGFGCKFSQPGIQRFEISGDQVLATVGVLQLAVDP